MSAPGWLQVGTRLRDWEGAEWRIHSVDGSRVELENPDLGRHEVLRADLIAWVEDGEWER